MTSPSNPVTETPRPVDECDLCGSAHATEVYAESDPSRHVLLCNECGLLYLTPRLAGAALVSFYDDDFEGDAGSDARAAGGQVSAKKIAKEERLARDWAAPLVRRYVTPKDKRILNLRCRTGALSALLAADGASVVSVDPFEANLRAARERRDGSRAFQVALPDFERMEIPGISEVDAVVSLNVHVLAHLVSPSLFLKRVLALLKPGGYLILDEKDRLVPLTHSKRSIFVSGDAHNYHFTASTVARAARVAGFEVVQCSVDPRRATGFRHVVLVARKPVGAAGLAARQPGPAEMSAGEILRRVHEVERTCRRWYRGRTMMRSLKRAVRALRPRP